MEEKTYFSEQETALLHDLWSRLQDKASPIISPDDMNRISEDFAAADSQGLIRRNIFGMHPLVRSLQVACIVSEEMELRRTSVMAVLLNELVKTGFHSLENVTQTFGKDVARIIKGLVKINDIYSKSPIVESENFKNLLLSFAEDMRVILIIIADRVNIMRQIRDTEMTEEREKVSHEAAYLYAPLAHKLGLYKIKSELEDLSVKYLYHDVYYQIKDKLNETKAERDRYIANFIAPIEEKLKEEGLHFHIKGRTKSIHSIWKKMQKQNIPFENIYDLFAIRIILDCEYKDEKKTCWQAYSIVTDMYQPNPKRLRDWLSVPKSNGYESLHITVMGPEAKWVEIQIRTERMDCIAEKGVAAHWRYKGIKDEGELDKWLKSVRETLEANDENEMKVMDQFKMDLYEDEVFIFTPKGDLVKLPKGATVLDFAFNIHTGIGCQCTGAKVNDRVVPIRQILTSGDQVSVITSPSQKPKRDWLKIVVTSKARTKIRQVLKEEENRQAQLGREELLRKFKNKKIELSESTLARLIVSMGFKNEKDFYQSIADEQIQSNDIIDKYLLQLKKETETGEDSNAKKAEDYVMTVPPASKDKRIKEDVLVIDKNLKGIEYKLAKCCNPIYGDEIFAFVNASGGIKIHRTDCPNAPELSEKFGYRILKARWDGKSEESRYDTTLRITGHDDIGIINNMTSIINKEEGVLLRSISISSKDDMFSGNMVVNLNDKAKLEQLIKKLQGVKGVMQVNRI